MSNPIEALLAAVEGMDELMTEGIDALNETVEALDARSDALAGLADALEISGHEPQAAIAASLRKEADELDELSATLRRLATANGTLREGHRLLRARLGELL